MKAFAGAFAHAVATSLALHALMAHAVEGVAPAGVVPDPIWVEKEVKPHTCEKPAPVPFSMKAIGGKADVQERAWVCGGFTGAEMERMPRQVGLVGAVAGIKAGWRVSIAGSQRLAVVQMTPRGGCNSPPSLRWALWKAGWGWAAAGYIPTMPDPCFHPHSGVTP